MLLRVAFFSSTSSPYSTHIHYHYLTFEGYPLNILDGVSTHQLIYVFVAYSSTYKPRGNRQLVWFSSQALPESRLAPQVLHKIEATNDARADTILAFMSNSEETVIDNAQPSLFGAEVLQSLVVPGPYKQPRYH